MDDGVDEVSSRYQLINLNLQMNTYYSAQVLWAFLDRIRFQEKHREETTAG